VPDVAAASTVAVFGTGRTAGAVYRPVESIVPTVAFPFATPFTDHVKVRLLDPETEALNCCVEPARTEGA
jgi:hypothetical protein